LLHTVTYQDPQPEPEKREAPAQKKHFLKPLTAQLIDTGFIILYNTSMQESTVAIEFGLPTGSAGMAAGMHGKRIRDWLIEWKNKYNVEIAVNANVHKDYRYWVVVEFQRDEDFTLFMLTWTHKTFMPWQRVE
jgi:hypothetical protein